MPPIKKGNDTWAKSYLERANNFAEHLEATFSPNDLSERNVPTISQSNVQCK